MEIRIPSIKSSSTRIRLTAIKAIKNNFFFLLILVILRENILICDVIRKHPLRISINKMNSLTGISLCSFRKTNTAEMTIKAFAGVGNPLKLML